jgi:hypothetical protein
MSSQQILVEKFLRKVIQQYKSAIVNKGYWVNYCNYCRIPMFSDKEIYYCSASCCEYDNPTDIKPCVICGEDSTDGAYSGVFCSRSCMRIYNRD